MADHQFNIKLGVKVEKGDSEKQLDNLKKSLEEKKITLKLDVTKLNEQLKTFKDSLNDVNKKLNDAFKLNNGALDNLKNLKTVLEEINKLSGKTKIQINNSKDANTITKNLETQKQKYAELMRLKQSLEKQRVGTTDTSAIQSLTQQIQLVEQEANKCKTTISKMTEIKLNTDMVKSLTSQFQTAKNQFNSLKSQMENTLKNTAMSKNQSTALKNMLNTVNQLNNKKIDTTTVGAEEKISKFINKLDELKNKYKNIKIEITAQANIDNAKAKIDKQINALKSALNSKTSFNAYIDDSKLQGLITGAEKLKEKLSNIKMTDNVEKETSKILSSLNSIETKFKEIQETAKASMKIEGNNASIEALKIKIDKLRDSEKLTAEQAQILKQKLEEISKLDTGKQTNAMKNLRNEITKAVNETSKLQSATKRTNTFFSNLYSTMSTFSLGNIISMQITKAIYGISDTIRELDKAFVGLTKVAPDSFHGTAEELENVRQKAVEVGQDVARSATDIINSTASALQLGINDMDKAMEYAKNVNIYANVSDQSEEIADKHIKSIMSAYGGVNESLDVMSNKVKGAGDNYSRLNDFMDEAKFCLVV